MIFIWCSKLWLDLSILAVNPYFSITEITQKSSLYSFQISLFYQVIIDHLIYAKHHIRYWNTTEKDLAHWNLEVMIKAPGCEIQPQGWVEAQAAGEEGSQCLRQGSLWRVVLELCAGQLGVSTGSRVGWQLWGSRNRAFIWCWFSLFCLKSTLFAKECIHREAYSLEGVHMSSLLCSSCKGTDFLHDKTTKNTGFLYY